VGIYSSIELHLGIISACLPFISPPIVKLSRSFSESRIFTYLKSSIKRNSKEETSRDTAPNDENQETREWHHKQRNKDPYKLPTTIDEELAIDGPDFIAVPDQWPLAKIRTEENRRLSLSFDGRPLEIMIKEHNGLITV
jgi:hypothetical protein